jgi:diguanylate cyclase (GGDEF)-like protein
MNASARACSPERRRQGGKQRHPADGSAKKVLVVEDDRIIARDLAGRLEDLGYEVVGCADCSGEALRLAAQQQPHVVLMDIRLRGKVDGIQTAAQMRAQHDVAIVYLSANTDAATLERVLETAPGGYLAKPYNDRTLRTTIEVALVRHAADLAARARSDTDAEEKRFLVEERQTLAAVTARLLLESTVDSLTGLSNRRHFDVIYARRLAAAERRSEALALVFFDLDHFKTLNDTFGHAAGDAVLRQIARVVRGQLRGEDDVCRYGGEEFAILLAATTLEDSTLVANRVCRAIAAHPFHDDDRPLGRVTASFGVAVFPEHSPDLFRAADAALYAAKHAGRNQVHRACPLSMVGS